MEPPRTDPAQGIHSHIALINKGMEITDVQGCDSQSATKRNLNDPQDEERNKRLKRMALQHSDEIVFYRGIILHTMPSLSKQLEGLTANVIGLQYVWEYRSPSQSVPPHYHCKLCSVAKLQDEMLDHIKGWKHSFRYMKMAYPEKVPFEEADQKRPTLKKTVKDIAAEVYRIEGSGELKVILKEPSAVSTFNGLRSAAPLSGTPLPPTGEEHPVYSMGQGPSPAEGSNSGDLLHTLGYLETFKIENERDAQLVCKLTRRLTDVLLEYRLGNVSRGPSSMFSGGFSSPSLPRRNAQFSGYPYPGPSRYYNDWNYK